MKNYTGTNYDSDRDIAEVAKLVRADLKRAVKEDKLPKGFKASVRIQRASMCQSLDICITACPDVKVMNSRRMLLDLIHPHRSDYSGQPIENVRRNTAEALEVIAFVDGIRQSYGYDRSGHEPDDYNNYLFAGDTGFDYALEYDEREAHAHECAALTHPDMTRVREAAERKVREMERDRERQHKYEERKAARRAARARKAVRAAIKQAML